MFGYIKPLPCKLSNEEQKLYKAIYCGLCHSLGEICSQPARFTLNYDFVFLALIRMAATNEVPTLTIGRCPSHPMKGCLYVKDSPSLNYCAALSVLLGYESIQDKLIDDKGFKHFSAKLCLVPYRKFLKKASKYHDLPIGSVHFHLEKLHQLENENCKHPDLAAKIFGDLLQDVSIYGIEDDLLQFAIGKIMFHIGKWIYLIDAADDFEKDKQNGTYNPFLPDGPNKELLANTLQWQLYNCDSIIDKLPCNDIRIQNLIKNILFYGTDAVAKSVLFPSKQSKGNNKKNERSI